MTGPRAWAARARDIAYGLGWSLTRRVPEPVAHAAFARVADQACRRGGPGVARLRGNLRRARPQAGDEELDELTRAAMRSYLRYWCEAFRLPEWSRAQVLERVVVHDEHIAREAVAAGRPVVAALPHLANWDLAGAWACLTGLPVTTVAERLEPERLFQRFVAYRERLGMEILPLTGGDGPILRTLAARAREQRLVCLVADRDLTATGVPVDLLGARASLPAGPAVVARASGAALMPVTLAYEPGTPRMHVRMHPLIEPAPGRGGVRATTQAVADAFTRGIRAAPQDWHMLQRVFLDDPVRATR